MRQAHRTDLIDGWQVIDRDDGGYGVYDEHGLIAGPFGTREGAIKAALLLPKRDAVDFPMRMLDREPG
jgi:hypothetical protein